MHAFLRSLLSLVIPNAVAHDANPVGVTATTFDNLQTAFNGESNANARYSAFAEKADEEGYGEAASLFRAAAKAEEIHARNHAGVLAKLGSAPVLKLEPVEVNSTRENLRVAMEGEVYERDVMYPEFIEAAKHQKEMLAIRTFTWAIKVEALHALLYQDALENLADRRGRNRKYYVCPDCGNTLETLSILKCLICGHRKSGFIAVE